MRNIVALMAVVVAVAGCAEASGESAAGQAVAGPGSVMVTARGDGELAVSWMADPNAVQYHVYQSAGGAPFTLAASVFDSGGGAPATSWIATGLTGGAQYCFAVEAAYSDGTTSGMGAAGCGTPGASGAPSPRAIYRSGIPANLFAPIGASPALAQNPDGPFVPVWRIPSGSLSVGRLSFVEGGDTVSDLWLEVYGDGAADMTINVDVVASLVTRASTPLNSTGIVIHATPATWTRYRLGSLAQLAPVTVPSGGILRLSAAVSGGAQVYLGNVVSRTTASAAAAPQ